MSKTYLIIVISITLILLSEKFTKPYIKKTSIISSVILFCIAIANRAINSDSIFYKKLYETLPLKISTSLISSGFWKQHFNVDDPIFNDQGYIIFNQLMKLISSDYRFLFFSICFITLLSFIFFFLRLIQDFRLFNTFLIFSLCYIDVILLVSNILRQSLATSIAIIGYTFTKVNPTLGILIASISGYFHWTIVSVYLMIYLSEHVNIEKKYLLYIIIISIIVSFFPDLSPYIKLDSISNSYIFNANSSNSRPGINIRIIYALIPIIIYFFFYDKKVSTAFKLLMNLKFVSLTASLIFIWNIEVFSRLRFLGLVSDVYAYSLIIHYLMIDRLKLKLIYKIIIFSAICLASLSTPTIYKILF